MGDADTRSGRDTRLLALVIAIALAVLFALAQFRFPEADQRSAPVATNPLERLAARASYDDLATTVSSVLQRVSTSVVMLDLMPAGSLSAGRAGGSDPALTPTALPSRSVRAVGVRLNLGAVVAHVPAGYSVAAPGRPAMDPRVDDARGITILRMPPAEDGSTAPAPVAGVTAFAYVAVIEAALGGPTVKPAFIGRLDPVDDEHWGGQLLVVGGTPELPVGALVYTLEGRFVGLVVSYPPGGRALAPLSALERAAAANGRQEGGGGRP